MSDFLSSEVVSFAECADDQEFDIAMDIGSTQTRSCVFNKDLTMSPAIILDSNYDIINRDISHVSSPSKSFGANLEMTITDLSADKKVKPMLSVEHVVKGELLTAITTTTQITVASASKVDQKTTYVNIISNVAIDLLQEYTKIGVPKTSTYVYLTVALPPEDTKHKSRMDMFRERLAGEYKVHFSRLNVTLLFTLFEDKIAIMSEPEAVAVYQTVQKKLEDADDSVVCTFDVGGRSAGITFISDKRLLLDSCATINIGGARLAAIFSRELASSLNIQEPLVTRVLKAISTGTFRLGAQVLDVSEQLNAAKREFAELLFNEFIRAVDTNGIQLQNISKVYCSGRTFGEAPKSPSIMTYISEMFKERAAYTDFEIVEGATPLLTGVCLKGMMNG